MKITSLTKTTLPFAAIALLAATPVLHAATSVFDDFSTDPNIGSEWTEYSYYETENVATTWNSMTDDLDVAHTAVGAGNGFGLYRTGTMRSTTDSVTMTVNSLSRSGGSWGFVGLMISAVPQPGYVTTTDDSYTLRMNPDTAGNFQFMVGRTVNDGAGTWPLFTGTGEAFSGPYVLEIERVGDDYVFKANGATLYTTDGLGGDIYDTAAKDLLVNYQIVTAGDGSITANVDNFGVVAVPEPSTTALLGLGGLALILRRRK